MKAEIKNKKILVTGGAGFIGSNLCEKLIKLNNKVICLDNFSTGSRENIVQFENHKNFTLINGDIRNSSDIEKVFQKTILLSLSELEIADRSQLSETTD